MRHFLNVGHCQFDLWMANSAQQIIGKMIRADEQGCVIIREIDGAEHGYSWSVVQHVCLAP